MERLSKSCSRGEGGGGLGMSKVWRGAGKIRDGRGGEAVEFRLRGLFMRRDLVGREDLFGVLE